MNRKQLIIAAMATVLSVSAASAAVTSTNITGVSGSNGVYNIDPLKANGSVGYRRYDNFDLKSGDIANLIYQFQKNGNTRDLDTFVNLVNSKINIDGIVNTLNKNGSFNNGHAVFISPNGMAIGASGVLNVGRLSVVTPTQSTYNNFFDGSNYNYTNINNISQLKKSGNAPIEVNGYIFARNGIDLPGNNINVAGKVVNGMANQSAINSTSAAEALFNSLVNTDGTIKANSSAINSDGTLVFLHQTGSTGGINVSGNVVNLTQGSAKNGSVAITNNGANGLTMTGKVAANGKLSLYNKAGDMVVSGKLDNKNGELAVTNSANAANLNLSQAALTSTNDIHITNNGSGKLSQSGSAVAGGELAIINEAGGELISNATNKGNTIRIINRGNGMDLVGNTTATKSVSVRNYGLNNNSYGMTLGGKITAGEGVLIDNHSGMARLNNEIEVTNGNIAIMNRATALGMESGSTSNFHNVNGGKIAIKNKSASGMNLQGTITNTKGETAINNQAGTMKVAGTINNKNGNMGIINRGDGKMTLDADIDNNGKLKLANVNGAGFDIKNTVDNKNGNFSIYNEKGQLTVDGAVNNNGGYLYTLSRNASEGVATTASSTMATKGGNLAIKHNGTGTKGLDLNGTISNADGQIAINNYKGDMHVGGNITAKNNLGVINRAGGNAMTVDATIAANNAETNIKNNGSGDMVVNGEITHNGRLNVLANKGQLTLGGKIHNTAATAGENTMTYVAARSQGKGIEATQAFAADSTNGTILIKNITGSNGLNFAGKATSTNGQAEVYNMNGNMTVSGTVGGQPSVVLNKGAKLTVTDAATLTGDVKLVNKGSQSATVANKYANQLREKLK